MQPGPAHSWRPFELSLLARTATRIVNEVKGVNRVVYDLASKPPGTISGSRGDGTVVLQA